jgi:SAM-dependent methyltransferase
MAEFQNPLAASHLWSQKEILNGDLKSAVATLGEILFTKKAVAQFQQILPNFSTSIFDSPPVNSTFRRALSAPIWDESTGRFVDNELNLLLLIVILYDQNEYAMARELVEQLEHLAGENYLTQYMHGKLHFAVGDIESATNIWRSMDQENSTATTQLRLADIAKWNDQLQEYDALISNLQTRSSLHHEQQGPEDIHSFKNFMPGDQNNEKFFTQVIERIGLDANFLDIGCSNGSRLEYLFRRGFRKNGGLEINSAALDYFERERPIIFSDSQIQAGDICNSIHNIDDGYYDVVYSASVLSTIYDDKIVTAVAKRARKYILINEVWPRNSTLYPTGTAFHDYDAIFSYPGFIKLSCEQLASDVRFDSVSTVSLYQRH